MPNDSSIARPREKSGQKTVEKRDFFENTAKKRSKCLATEEKLSSDSRATA